MVKRVILLIVIALNAESQGYQAAASIPVKSVAAWGDSLTAGNEDNTGVTFPNVLVSLVNQYVYNGGVGGETSSQITARMLAIPTKFSRWSDYCTIIWSGRNNYASQSTVLADVASMVAIAPVPSCYLVMSVLNGEYTAEHSGGASYTQITSLNTALAAAYPGHYVDIRALLISQANLGNVLDAFDSVQDIPPASLRVSSAGTVTTIADSSTCSFTYTLTSGALIGGAVDVLLVGTEYIQITSTTGANPYTSTGCTRGYASSTATSHSNAAAITDYGPLHLNAAGYTYVAQQVAPLIQAMRP